MSNYSNIPNLPTYSQFRATETVSLTRQLCVLLPNDLIIFLSGKH